MTARLVAAGAAGSVLMALGAWTAGALPGEAPQSVAAALVGDHWWFRVGLAAYVLGLGTLAVAWWRTGARLPAGGYPWWWVAAVAALWALPLLVSPPLGSRDVYAYACQGAAWRDGHDPYAVGAEAAGCRWLEAVPALWHDTTAPYGPLGLAVAAVAVAAARVVASGDAPALLWTLAGLRGAATGGVVLAAATLPTVARACRVAPARATWLGVATPPVGVHAVSGAHNDAWVLGLVVAGLAAAVRPTADGATVVRGAWLVHGLAVLGGAALGLAAAVKITAAVALPFAVLLAAGRAGSGWRAGTLVATAAAGAFLLVTVVTGLGTGWTAALADTGALVQWSSWPTGLGMAVGYLLDAAGVPPGYDGAVAAARAVGLAALAVTGVVLVAQAWRRRADTRAVVSRAGAAAGAVVLLGPVFYPWYALLPLAVLAAATTGVRARQWLAVATLAVTALTLPSGLGVPVVTKGPGAVAVAAATVVLTVWSVARRRRGSAARCGPAPGHGRAPRRAPDPRPVPRGHVR